jgi:hypothetical protein
MSIKKKLVDFEREGIDGISKTISKFDRSIDCIFNNCRNKYCCTCNFYYEK